MDDDDNGAKEEEQQLQPPRIQLKISLDHDDGVIRARGWLKGVVTVLVGVNRDENPAITGGELHVDMVGKESAFAKSHGVVGGLCNLATSCSVNSKKEEKIFEEHRVLHDFDEQPSTDHDKSYHFSIYLPGSLPPSMEFEEDPDGGGGYCSVQYYLTARLQEAQGEEGGAYAEHPLKIIGEPLSTKLYPYNLGPTAYPLKQLLGLVNSGYVVLAARVENTHVCKGGNLEFSVACHNKSRHDIEQVNVFLLEDILWKTSGRGSSPLGDHTGPGPHLHTVNRTIRLATYEDLLLGSLQKESATDQALNSSSTSWTDEVPDVDILTLGEMHNDLMAERNALRIVVPREARESYHGKYIKVTHHIQVDMVVKGKTIGGPTITIPIKIFDSSTEEVLHHSHSPSMTTARKNIESIATTTWQDNEPLNPEDIHNPFAGLG